MAVAFDTSTDGGLTIASNTLTWSHTCSGANRVLYVGCFGGGLTGGDQGDDSITGVTYNGVSMTLVGKTINTGDRYVYLWELVNPASGANDIVISSTLTVIAGVASSYTGCTTHESATTYTDIGTSITVLLLSVAANSWTVMVTKNDVGTASAGTGTTTRQSTATGLAIFDSNGPLAPGNQSLQATIGSSALWAAVMAIIPPASGGSTTWPGYTSPFGWS